MVIKSMLHDQIGETTPRETLYCPKCGAEYSANAGDYWYLPDDHGFTCECGSDLILAKMSRGIEVVAA